MNLEFLYVDSDRAAEASNFITEVISQQDMYNERARMKECEKYTPAQILRCVDEDPQSILLCLRDNEILGFISTRDEDDLRWINWFGVARSHHGKGVASALLHVAIEEFSSNHWKIWCDTRDINFPSIRVLKKLGFREICRIERHWYGQDFCLWERYLDG
jgi:ribosomal protein S18 acetylase RimI-like enzyme